MVILSRAVTLRMEKMDRFQGYEVALSERR